MEATVNLPGNDTKYRLAEIGANWAKSRFEYLSPVTGEWREVMNWNNRERLFNEFMGVAA